jgi:hypothetical protein
MLTTMLRAFDLAGTRAWDARSHAGDNGLLGVSQAEVSKMERRTELYVGTLRKFIEAMNGELVIAARFADGVEVPIRLAEEEDAA